jgi:D-threo-aldose 1-dehydrogenase
VESDVLELGSSGVTVSRFGLGTAPLGGLFEAVGEVEARAVIERAIARGIRLFDTAPLYGCGLAELRLGRALADVPRDRYVIATKVGRLLQADLPADDHRAEADEALFHERLPLHPVLDFSRDGILRSIEDSLERLGIERLDIVHIHDPDDHFEQALDEAYPTLDKLRAEGTIGGIGVGMSQARLLVEFARSADFDCFLLAGRYTLLDQSALDELLPLCEERGIAVIIGGVYNSGILADPSGSPRFDYRAAPAVVVEQAQRMAVICERHGVPLRAAAVQFPLAHPAVASVLVGCRSAVEVDDNADGFSRPIPPAVFEELKTEGFLPADAPVPS